MRGMEKDATRGHERPAGADATAPEATSGWVTTEVAARAIRVSPRTIRRLIERGELVAKPQGEGVRRTWLVSVDSLHELRVSRAYGDEKSQGVRDETEIADNIADVLREMTARLEERTAELVEMRTRLELTERAQSTLEEEARSLREENERLRSELEAEQSKGFWRRLLGG